MEVTKIVPDKIARPFATSALSPEERAAAISELASNGPFAWQEAQEKDAITKTFEFADFNQAWSFMSRSALLAEKPCA